METTVAAGEFKAKCSRLLDVVARQREEIIITKHGHPVARLVPMPPDRPLFGAMAGSAARRGDLVTPTGESWETDT